ncbi:Cytokinin dehydrogenase 5 [Capsicum annuum]|uniref:cytokinin dehydrogenase n=1 Tax=Capsicum annuum TaxID=4072 RepID=A0A2G3ANX6_CAPAN|nr:Cytokinin dehydrogenase 5 [Capsicum annuum]
MFPAAVLYPSNINDIIDLIKFSYDLSVPFHVAARGHGHSIRGQAMAHNGVIVEMNSLNNNNDNDNNNNNNNNENCGIKVSWDSELGFYADVGGEQLWIAVLRTTLEYGLAPISWTDYLYLTVGGTLSNAGISGQTFRHGPQITNVHEMDVITGKGDFVTCSKDKNSELFFAVLGGLGQFGIITRARIVLDKAPTRVKWVRLLYDDFSKFTKDQEHLISIDGLDYVEGSLMLEQSSLSNWRSSFFPPSNQTKIASFLSQNKTMYCLEMVKYYDDHTASTIDEELKKLVKGLNYLAGFMFKKDATFVEFLNRVRSGELELHSKGMWAVPHPWLNLFVPKSSIMDFNVAVFVDIILRQNKATGPILVYPTYRKKLLLRINLISGSSTIPPPHLTIEEHDSFEDESSNAHPMDSEDHSMELEDLIFSEEAREECGLGSQTNHTFSKGTNFQLNQTFSSKTELKLLLDVAAVKFYFDYATLKSRNKFLKDTKNHIYLIAFCVVDKKNDVSWMFFFEKLKFIVVDGPDLCFISTRHMSIANSIARAYNHAHHEYCIRYLGQNL